MTNPSRGEVWLINLDPTVGHEQAGTRPALVISADGFNHGPAGLVVIVPITSRDKRIASHIRVEPKAGGLRQVSFIMAEALRCVSKERLVRPVDTVDSKIIAEVEYAMTAILGL